MNWTIVLLKGKNFLLPILIKLFDGIQFYNFQRFFSSSWKIFAILIFFLQFKEWQYFTSSYYLAFVTSKRERTERLQQRNWHHKLEFPHRETFTNRMNKNYTQNTDDDNRKYKKKERRNSVQFLTRPKYLLLLHSIVNQIYISDRNIIIDICHGYRIVIVCCNDFMFYCHYIKLSNFYIWNFFYVMLLLWVLILTFQTHIFELIKFYTFFFK
jgi:hypothetical protein